MMGDRLGRIDVAGDVSRIVVGVAGRGEELVGGAVMDRAVAATVMPEGPGRRRNVEPEVVTMD